LLQFNLHHTLAEGQLTWELPVPILDTVLEPEVPPSLAERAAPAAPVAVRLLSVDLLRGLVMILMALDHARFYFASTASSPEYLPNSSPALFFTRWLTHFCAPAFFFLAGTSGFLSGPVGGHRLKEVSRFFWTRGLWLIFLGFTVIDYAGTGLFFDPYGGVIWCLGLCMVVIAPLIRLPRWAVAAFGLALIIGHHLLDPIAARRFGNFAVLWSILHSPGVYPVGTGHGFFVLFTLIPWVGVMAAGYAYGPVLLRPDRRKILFWSGAILTAVFLLLRFFNLYGNGSLASPYRPSSIGPWTVQSSLAMTLVSFFNTVKYPASLQFLLMTLGPVLMVLAYFDSVTLERSWARVLLVYGRVPLFFYILHPLVLRTTAIWVSWIQQQDASWLQYGGPRLILPPPSYGHGLPFIYAMWLGVVAVLYLPCKWFMQVKKSHPSWWWLRYL
jgi:uncharacterized membrane protein